MSFQTHYPTKTVTNIGHTVKWGHYGQAKEKEGRHLSMGNKFNKWRELRSVVHLSLPILPEAMGSTVLIILLDDGYCIGSCAGIT